MKKPQSLTAAEFFESLQQDNLITAVPITLIGMVKKSEGKEKTIQFALGGNCSNWATIPLELIEDVEIIKTVTCKDHTHPLVRLNLKTPKNPEAKIFSSILLGMQSTLDGMQPTFAGRQVVDEWGDPVCGPGTKKKCYLASCPNPSGHGTIWCTKCRCEAVFNPHPEGFASYYGF
jgi:hypothetical protein